MGNIVKMSILKISYTIVLVISFLSPTFTYAVNFTQSSWSGGADTVSAPSDSVNQINWVKYYSQSGLSANSTLTLASTTYTFTDDGATSTSPLSSSSGGGFGNGSFSSTVMSGSGSGASIGIFGSPVTVGVKKVVGGYRFSCVLKVDGLVSCFGYGGRGELGDGLQGSSSATPVQVAGLTAGTVKDIEAGQDNVCAVKVDSSLVCWGANYTGQSGTNTGTADVLTPTQVYGFGAGSVAQVSVGTVGTCAVKVDGSAWCWGGNSNGKIGDNTTIARATPV